MFPHLARRRSTALLANPKGPRVLSSWCSSCSSSRPSHRRRSFRIGLQLRRCMVAAMGSVCDGGGARWRWFASPAATVQRRHGDVSSIPIMTPARWAQSVCQVPCCSPESPRPRLSDDMAHALAAMSYPLATADVVPRSMDAGRKRFVAAAGGSNGGDKAAPVIDHLLRQGTDLMSVRRVRGSARAP